MVTQLEHHQQERPCPDPVERTKSLICALNFISRNLPVPPDVYDTVSSIYYGEQEADDDVVHDDGGSDEGPVPEKASVRVFKDTLLIFFVYCIGNCCQFRVFCDVLLLFCWELEWIWAVLWCFWECPFVCQVFLVL